MSTMNEAVYIKELEDGCRVLFYNPYSHALLVGNQATKATVLAMQAETEVADQEQKNIIVQSGVMQSKADIIDSAKKLLAQNQDVHQLYMILTTGCNYACKYCRQKQCKSSVATDIMSKETAHLLIDTFMQTPSTRKKGIVFYGGEPLLAKDVLLDAIAYIRSLDPDFKVELNLFTNGSMASAEVAEFFAQNQVFIIVSYDGLPEANDKLRVMADGAPTSAETVSGFKMYKEHGCKVGISMTVGGHNIDTLDDSIKYLTGLNPENIGFNLPHDDEKNPLRADQPVSFVNNSIDKFWHAATQGLYVEHIIRKVRLFVERRFKFVECPAAFGRIVAMPNGDLGFCEGAIGYDNFFFPEQDWANMESKRACWKNSLPIFDQRCAKCPAIGICGGGCPLDGYFANQELSNFDSVRCEFAKVILDKMLEKIAAMITCNNECYIVSDEDRLKLFRTLVPESLASKPLDTSASIGDIKI